MSKSKVKAGRPAAEINQKGFAGLVANRIRKARLESSRPLEELAAAAGMSRISWWRFETGESLAEFGAKLDAIATALGVPVESLTKPLKEAKESHATAKATDRGNGKGAPGGRGKSDNHGKQVRGKSRATGV